MPRSLGGRQFFLISFGICQPGTTSWKVSKLGANGEAVDKHHLHFTSHSGAPYTLTERQTVELSHMQPLVALYRVSNAWLRHR